MTCDFIDRVIESQKVYANSKKPAVADQKSKRAGAPVSTSSLTPQEIFKKMRMSRGISIKKVVKPPQDEDDDVIVCSSPESEVMLVEVGDDQNEELTGELLEWDEDSDDDFNPSTSQNGSTGSKAKKSESVFITAPINFTCAMCKNSFETFEILSEHMKERSCFVEVNKCNVCEKEFQNKRTLYSHMNV